LKIKRLLIIGFLFFTLQLFAQQYNFSQFYNTPLNVNPAFTGNFAQDVKVGLIYRNQWSSLSTTPYETASLGSDINFKNNFLKADLLGAGLLVVNDRSPDGVFQSNIVMLSAAVHQYLDDENRHKISGGLQLGIGINSVNLSDKFFANQIDPRTNSFNSSISSGEDVSALSKTYVNGNIGGAYEFIASKKATLYLSAALFNLTRYQEGNINSTVPLKYNGMIGVNYFITDKLSVLPTIFITTQSLRYDLIGGINLSYSFLPKSSKSSFVATLGAWYRVNDAAIVYGGMRFNNIKIGMSYDFTASSLNTISSSFGRNGLLGAWEISLIYVGFLNRGVPSDVSVPCKIF
jgi:type IX secretion system PorP/SprF family membrane protein